MIHAIKELYNAFPALARGVRVYEIREAMEKWRTYKIV